MGASWVCKRVQIISARRLLGGPIFLGVVISYEDHIACASSQANTIQSVSVHDPAVAADGFSREGSAIAADAPRPHQILYARTVCHVYAGAACSSGVQRVPNSAPILRAKASSDADLFVSG